MPNCEIVGMSGHFFSYRVMCACVCVSNIHAVVCVCCKLLGVFFHSSLKTDSHVQYILSQCAQSMYVLKLLRIV